MTLTTALILVAGALLLGGLAGWSLAAARVGSAQVRTASLQAQLDAERSSGAERVRSLQADQLHLAEQFRALAADALATNNEQFLALADQRLAASQQTQFSELARREEAVKQLVEPLTRTLDQVKAEMTLAEKARLTGTAALGEQVRAMRESSDLLRTETSQLVTALRSSQVRGRWGEIQLRRVVESAGMVEHVDFVEQDQVRTDDGLLRPDMIINLSGGKNVVVDAKVAFLGYLDATQATDDTVRAQRLAAHARHFRKHIDDLATKRYWDQFAPAPEFVVMFVPAEAFFHAALEQDATIFEYAFERNVIVATPMTLIALLRTVAYAWRQDALAANAQQVLTLGKELHGRIATLGGHLAKLGRALDGAAGAYNQTVSSLETRVLVSARRFADLQVVDGDLPTPPPVNPQLSAVSAPELVASATEQMVALADVPRTDAATSAG
ncbi:DNA recombination protein RmuC [Pengzhenrongella frigida]|uniref:DNA recombination protein RmuC n=1 Tax=Pengzhenrongella frigida TaxID=1259133 RepID=A0A4V1ZH17_9MICO|nr:DNA recombination protein RmuC [Cellulomonas sp. HLT2-17]RYV50484.1 DNA recombination protein RmuC [Cellulomonas sp. HLT2-17]